MVKLVLRDDSSTSETANEWKTLALREFSLFRIFRRNPSLNATSDRGPLESHANCVVICPTLALAL